MDLSLVWIVVFIIFTFLFSILLYISISKITVRKKFRKEIEETFNAKEYGDALRFNYRGYDVLATFRGVVKFSVLHNKEYRKGEKPPRGMKLTPLYLIIKIKKISDMRKLLDDGIDFLESL